MITKYTLFCETLKNNDMWNIIPQSVKELYNIFEKSGKKLYVVGGAVRDFLTGDKPKDFDLCTDALPDDVIKILQSNGYDFNVQGKAFGVVVVYTDDQPDGMEIATFRQDTTKGRNPEVKLGVSIEDDVKRRDLTYNALFYDLDKKEVVDLVGGVSDLKNKITRMVGDPLERIDEDSLRILRAFRLATRYKRPLDETLIKAIKSRNQLQNEDPETGEMKRISQERIWEEIKKTFKQSKENFKTYLEFFNEFDMWEQVFPGSKINTKIVETEEFTSYIANLFKFDTQNLEKRLVQEYRVDSETSSIVAFLTDLLLLKIDNCFELYKKKIRCKVTNHQIIDWLDTCNISSKIFVRFIDYEPDKNLAIKLMDAGFKGKELGLEIAKVESERFKKLLE